jgi:hypothetical protein
LIQGRKKKFPNLSAPGWQGDLAWSNGDPKPFTKPGRKVDHGFHVGYGDWLFGLILRFDPKSKPGSSFGFKAKFFSYNKTVSELSKIQNHQTPLERVAIEFPARETVAEDRPLDGNSI